MLLSQQEAEARRAWLRLAVETVRESMDYLLMFPEKIKLLLEEHIGSIEPDAMEFMKLEHMAQLADAVEAKISSADEVTEEFVGAMFKEIQKEFGIKGKNLFMGTRVLLTGQMHGPDINKLLTLLGKDKLIIRIEEARKNL